MTNFRYVPLLKGKRGEFLALSVLNSEIKRRIMPFIDVSRGNLNFETSDGVPTPKVPIETHVAKVALHASKYWGREQSIFFDLFDVPLETRATDGTHPVHCLFERLFEQRVSAIPVFGLDRDEEFVAAIRDVAQEGTGGVCLRLLAEDLLSSSHLRAVLEEQTDKFEKLPEGFHLLFDLRSFSSESLETDSARFLEILRNLPAANRWGSVTLAGSSFPENMKGIEARAQTRRPRLEWLLWKSIFSQRGSLPRVPNFGDYGVVHPNFTENDPRLMARAGKIRYTIDKEWIIIRGYSMKKEEGPLQTHRLAEQLSILPEFLGAEYSWGDSYIVQCANRSKGPGNPETWVKADTCHHLTFVTNQLASFDVV